MQHQSWFMIRIHNMDTVDQARRRGSLCNRTAPESDIFSEYMVDFVFLKQVLESVGFPGPVESRQKADSASLPFPLYHTRFMIMSKQEVY